MEEFLLCCFFKDLYCFIDFSFLNKLSKKTGLCFGFLLINPCSLSWIVFPWNISWSSYPSFQSDNLCFTVSEFPFDFEFKETFWSNKPGIIFNAFNNQDLICKFNYLQVFSFLQRIPALLFQLVIRKALFANIQFYCKQRLFYFRWPFYSCFMYLWWEK